MYKLKYSSKIKRDLKACQKRGWDFDIFEDIVNTLRIPEPLDPKNKDHKLKGNYGKFREKNQQIAEFCPRFLLTAQREKCKM